MAKLPAFQFYPGDWMKDPNLRRCSHAAKGIWMDILCLMFESDERGFLVSAGRAWTADEVVCAVGGDRTLALAGLHELTTAGVVSLDSRGAYFCRRMVRDEEIRQSRRESGVKGAERRWQTDGKPYGKPMANGMAKAMAKNGSSDSASSSASASVPSLKEISDQNALGSGTEADAEWGQRRTKMMLVLSPVRPDSAFITELVNASIQEETVREYVRKALQTPNVNSPAAYVRRCMQNDGLLSKKRRHA